MGQYTAFPINNRTFTDYSKLVFATDFGVVADGVTDDTAALNACFASVAGQTSTVVLPTGFCKTSDSVTVGTTSTTGPQSHINILGAGSPATSGIVYNGPTDRPLLIVSRMTNFYFSNFAVNNLAGSKGTTVAIALGGRNNPADFGNLTNNFQFYAVNVALCDIGIRASGRFGAASEGSFYNCGFGANNTGFVANDFNSLDFNFYLPAIGENVIGLDSGVSSGYNVYGGSGSNNGTDFMVRAGGNCYIQGWRSEVAGLTLEGAVSPGVATMNGCNTASPTGTRSIGGRFTRLCLRDNIFNGSVELSAPPRHLEMVGNALAVIDTARRLPFIANFTDQVLLTNAILKDNEDTAVGFVLPNLEGTIGWRNNGAVTSPFYEPCITKINPEIFLTTPVIGCGWLALSHVRHLGEGTVPGAPLSATPPTPGKNLRVSATFPGAGSVAFTFVRTLADTTCNGTHTCTANVGIFRPTDVGKPLKITNGNDLGGDWYGYIMEVLTPTTALVFPASFATPGGRNPNQANKVATIGEDEPDAKYMVVGLVGNVNETFWVSAQSATGITFNSSNAASTAIINALIVR